MLGIACCAGMISVNAQSDKQNDIIQMALISDLHYGAFRDAFEGEDSVASYKVNNVMLAKLNALPGQLLPDDGGVCGGKQLNYIDYLAVTGNITHRQEVPFQCAADSWRQFSNDYIQRLTTRNRKGDKTSLLLTPGNQDASNCVGYYKPMYPATDATAMVNIFNMMMRPAIPRTTAGYNYETDKINYSLDVDGIHFMFIQLWPDSVNRVWMENDLKQLPASTPVLLFTHVQPKGDARQFTNPNPPHGINIKDHMENLMPEYLKDTTLHDGMPVNQAEQREFAAFVKKHPAIKAYFHGHDNDAEYYIYKGPDSDISLPVFKVDSPVKGKLSGKEEKKLSFSLITIDARSKKMTVRECLWNSTGTSLSPVVWGKSITIAL